MKEKKTRTRYTTHTQVFCFTFAHVLDRLRLKTHILLITSEPGRGPKRFNPRAPTIVQKRRSSPVATSKPAKLGIAAHIDLCGSKASKLQGLSGGLHKTSVGVLHALYCVFGLAKIILLCTIVFFPKAIIEKLPFVQSPVPSFYSKIKWAKPIQNRVIEAFFVPPLLWN